MLPKNLLGCSLPVAALEQLRHYSYKGGGSTPIDRFMNPWWEWVASKLPLWVSPNVLTLLGFFCTLIPMIAVTVYMPHMEEAAPRELYYAIGLLLFIYQTLDAVDGKQARRTNTSTPLGQLFDHGCDAFSTIFVVFINWAVLRMGLGFYAYLLLALVQMQLMVYTWWELHFNVYRCCTGGAGVTEGQLVTIGMVLLAGVLGPDVFLLKLSQIIPLSLQKTAAEMLPAWLLHQRIQMLVSFPFYVLLIYLLISDVIDGWCRVPNRFTAMSQLIGCFAHVAFQFAFYCSDLLVSHPATSYALLIVNSSIVALRMTVAATCKLRLSPVHWPVLPFYIASIYFYCAAPRAGSPLALLVKSPLSLKQLHQQQLAAPWLLAAVLLWSAVYLYNFLTSTIGAICTFLNISCFYIDKQHHALPRERLKQPKQAKELQAVPASVTATTGIKRRGAAP